MSCHEAKYFAKLCPSILFSLHVYCYFSTYEFYIIFMLCSNYPMLSLLLAIRLNPSA